MALLATVVTSLVTLATVIANAVITSIKEKRLRKWDVEDRAAKAKEAAEARQEQTAGLHRAIADNTVKTLQATAAAKQAAGVAAETKKTLETAITEVAHETNQNVKALADGTSTTQAKLDALAARFGTPASQRGRT